MSSESQDWQQMCETWFEYQAQGPVPQLPVAVACYDPNPWDNGLRCRLPSGHRAELHEAAGEHDTCRWTSACHFPGDDCGPAAHLVHQEATP